MRVAEQFYEAHATDHPEVDDRLRKVVSLVLERRPATLLDIGCGRGTLVRELGKYISTESFVGTEISEQLCRLARTNGVSAVVHDAAGRLPFEDATYEMVVFGELIEHLFDPDFAVDEIYRVLQPGGALILTTPNLACWANRILLPMGIQPIFTETSSRKKYGRRFKVLGQNSTVVEGHIRVMTTSALLELLVDRGFRIAKVAGARFNAFAGNPVTKLVDGMCSRLPALASAVIVVALKSSQSHAARLE